MSIFCVLLSNSYSVVGVIDLALKQAKGKVTLVVRNMKSVARRTNLRYSKYNCDI